VETLIRAENVHRTYVLGRARIPVLRGASLSVQPGESVAVTGVSGSGKSTLLHVLGGLDRPEAGRVWIAADDLYGLGERARSQVRAARLGFVFQSYHLLPEMTVLENVFLPAMALGGWTCRRTETRLRALDLIEQVGLKDRAQHRPMELSGGEQQRVALARALMNDPAVILADEPTGNLDEATGGHVLECLFRLTRAGGHALLMVTHHQATAKRCDRILHLQDGVLA
jgi:predicted ABC-type transport system involved in lysophospholipase L1 biosynthesis ATPase subunit